MADAEVPTGIDARAVVLVEGTSDRVAVETLAERRGRDLDAEGVSVVAIGGAQAIGKFLRRFGPQGLDVRLAGLCDAAEVGDFGRGLARAGLGARPDAPRDGAAGLLRMRGRSGGRADPCPRRPGRGAGGRGAGRAGILPHPPEAGCVARTSRPRTSCGASWAAAAAARSATRACSSRRSSPPRCPGRSTSSSGTSDAARPGSGRQRVRTTTSLSTPDSAPHTSPRRPRICLTFAGELGSRTRVNLFVWGSNRTRAFAPKSLSQTSSRLVDVDGVRHRRPAREAPFAPAAGGRRVDGDLAGVPLAHPDPPLRIRPRAARALVARRRLQHAHGGTRDVHAAEVAAREGGEVDGARRRRRDPVRAFSSRRRGTPAPSRHADRAARRSRSAR